MQIFGKTDRGKVRSDNQDAFFTGALTDNIKLAVVCDGMGGAKAGNVASSMAVKHISEYIINSFRPSLSADGIIKIINNAVVSANIVLYDAANSHAELKGMGTTAVVAVVCDSSVYICNIGDSRAYKINSNGISQITRDHSVVQSLVESGELTAEEARVHPDKNVITRALGTEKNVVCDCYEIGFDKDDILLICTDGLTNFLDNESILKYIRNSEISSVCEKLINAANMSGGGDNITAVVCCK